ncbi:hypothetical protein LCGC14_0245740 [marine sediment metagenome]|uniref:Uncharacterized protein n=1 Tax=marine sediment metagenome TaxID=412755 RepID=A0A0F9XAI9_9ZZZZ
MNYEIIKDPAILREFIDWLPELEPHETYYLALFARNKYARDIKHIQTDKAQLKRVVTKKDRIESKIKQMECAVGSYTHKGDTIPQEALALYITPNPRCQIKAAKYAARRLVELVTEPYSNYNTHQIAMSEVHKACSRKVYFDMDFDGVDLDPILHEMIHYINMDAITVLQTRGGFHILVELKKIRDGYVKTWYKGMTTITGCDIKGDNMIPVPGCTQGNFIPSFLYT